MPASRANFLLAQDRLEQPVWFILAHALNANVDAAAEARARVKLRGGARPDIGIGNDEVRGGLRARAVILPGERLILAAHRLIAQAELQAVVAGLQTGLVERLLELRLLILQELQRVGALGRHVRRDLTVAVDFKMDVDAAKLRRIEPNVELIGAGLRLCRDGDG